MHFNRLTRRGMTAFDTKRSYRPPILIAAVIGWKSALHAVILRSHAGKRR